MTASARAHYHLTSFAAVPPLLAVVLFGLLWLTGNGWFLLLAGAATAIFGLGVTGRAQIDDLRFRSRYERRVTVGQQQTYVLQVVNGGGRTTSPVVIVVHNDGLSDVTLYVGPLRPGECASFETRRAALKRQVTEHMQVDMVSTRPLGVTRAHLQRVYDQHLTIHPGLRESTHDPRTRGPVGDSAAATVRGSGTEPLGVREWRPGDDHRHVHWRSTARRGRLVVLERADTAVLLLQLVLIGPAHADGFESALASAAGACDKRLRSGQPVTVAGWLPGGLTLAPTGSRLELLDWWSSLVEVDSPDPRGFAAAAIAAFGTGELLVAGPPATLDAWLPAAGPSCAPLRLRRLEVGA